jgi:putative protease
MLPELFAANVASVKIEGRQRSPAYVEQVTRTWRAAIDRYLADPANYHVEEVWNSTLANVSEGSQTTLGAYHRKWQ